MNYKELHAALDRMQRICQNNIGRLDSIENHIYKLETYLEKTINALETNHIELGKSENPQLQASANDLSKDNLVSESNENPVVDAPSTRAKKIAWILFGVIIALSLISCLCVYWKDIVFEIKYW